MNDFKPIMNDNNIYINLQYGKTRSEINEFKKQGYNLHSFDELDIFNDFESCLSILNNLDIFVTVSNSTAHLAASLGVKTIIICPKKSSTYYYWDYNNGLTPWYNNVKVIKYKDSLINTVEEANKAINKLLWN